MDGDGGRTSYSLSPIENKQLGNEPSEDSENGNSNLLDIPSAPAFDGRPNNEPGIPKNTKLTQFDLNVYQQKKTLAQGMMDLALLSANANQLRYILEQPENSRDGFFYISLTFILMSLFLQVSVGIGLIWNGLYNINKSNHCHRANQVNNITVIGIFLVTILNVFISAFGIPSTSAVSTAIAVPAN